MGSRTAGTLLPAFLQRLVSAEAWREWISSAAPIGQFKIARGSVIQMYSYAYSEIDDFQDSFSEFDNPDLREWAIKPYARIPEYDPHEAVKKLLSVPQKALTLIKYLSIVLFVAGSAFSVNWLRILGKGGFSLVESLEGVIPLGIIAIGIVYLWFLRADTFVHQTLSKELRVGQMKVATRNRSQIVAYGVWNRSLMKQVGLLLVGFFFIFDSLPKLPIIGRWFSDPSQHVIRVFANNISIFYESDSVLNAMVLIFRESI